MVDDELVGEEEAAQPRKRLAQFLFYRCENVEALEAPDDEDQQPARHRNMPGADTMESEILRLAKDHPEIFEKDFTWYIGRGWDQNRIGSPLSFIMSFRYDRTDNAEGNLVSLDVFEAAFEAHPESLTALDSEGTTVLEDLIDRYSHFEYSLQGGNAAAEKKARWVDLVKRVVDKNPAKVLAVKTPIIQAISRRIPLEVINFLIERHPGDPYREESQSGENMLSAVVVQRDSYPLEFLRNIFDQNPAAAKARNIGRYSQTVLHYACSCASQHPHVIRFILDADPAAAFVPGRDRELPLFHLVQAMRDYQSESLEMVAMANPRAIFTNYMHHKEFRPSSAFSLICDDLLKDKGQRSYICRYQWKHLYFLMNAYRFGSKLDISRAWKAPQFPLHLAASCPCPSTLLLHMATAYPDQLVKVDSQGRSVLALALESGHSMAPITTSYGGKQRFERCIQTLVEKNASALGLRDSKTQLFPFQIAATMEEHIFDMIALDNKYYRPDRVRGNTWSQDYHSEMKKEMKDEAHLACFNTVYYLLRADPSKVLSSNSFLPDEASVEKCPAAKRRKRD